MDSSLFSLIGTRCKIPKSSLSSCFKTLGFSFAILLLLLLFPVFSCFRVKISDLKICQYDILVALQHYSATYRNPLWFVCSALGARLPLYKALVYDFAVVRYCEAFVDNSLDLPPAVLLSVV
jgi:hypothetical protein